MAERVTKDTIEKLDAKLECSICLKQPKLLPCYHVFCKSLCLEKLVTRDGRSLTCPTCRHIVPLLERGVAGLQSDFHIDHLHETRDALNKATESAKTQCGNCEEERATGYCRECQDFLCEKCQAHHQALKKTRSHHIINLQEFQQEFITAKKTTPTCEKHPQTELRIYCDTCKELICYDCTIQLHKDHNYDPVTDVFPKHREELVSSLKPLKHKLDKVQQALKVFDNLAKDIHDQKVTLKADIHKEIDEQHRLLDQRKTQLVGELETLTKQKLEALATQKECVEMTKVKLTSCLEYAEGAIKIGTQYQVLEMKAPVLEIIEQISTEFDQDCLCPKIDFTALITQDKKQLTKLSQSYLKLYSGSRDASVNGDLKKATINQIAQFELSIDTYPSLVVDAMVTHCQSRTVINYQIVKSNNKYQITYTPTKRGIHEINLTINGTHVRGSPFTVVAMPQPHTLGVPSKVISNLKRPWGVAVNSKGHVIVAEYTSGRIMIYDKNYEQIQTFDSRGNASAGVTIDGDDNIYVSDREKHNVQKFTANGQFLSAVGTKGNQRLQFNAPCGLSYNNTNDKVYVSDNFNNRVQVLNTDLTFHSIINTIGLKQTADISFDSVGNAYIANFNAHNVMVCDSNGKLLRKFGTKGNGPRQLSYPLGITVSNTDTVYVAEMSGNRISIFKTNGEFIHSIGSKGTKEGEFSGPAGIAIDSEGHIVVTDRESGRIQVF